MATINRNRKSTPATPALTRDAAITKQELAVASAQYGAGNSAAFEGFEANTLRLVTFIGDWDARQRKFIGKYLFQTGGSWLAGEVDRITDFARLPGIALHRQKRRAVATPEPVGNDAPEEVNDVAGL